MTDPDGDGVYTVTIPLAPGRYQYKFVVDGQWFQDPNNPEEADDGYGGHNSVVDVPAGVTGVKAEGGQPAAMVWVDEARGPSIHRLTSIDTLTGEMVIEHPAEFGTPQLSAMWRR